MKNLTPFILIFISGLLYTLGFPTSFSESLLITPIIASCILFYYLLKDSNIKQKIFQILVFNFSFNLFAFYWVASTLEEFGHLPYWLALILSTSFTFIITPHLWALLLIIILLRKYLNIKESIFLSSGLFTFSTAVVLTLLEHYVPAQFPTNIGTPWASLSPYLGYASIGGLNIYSFFSYLIVFELLSYINFKKVSKFNISTIFIFIISNPFLVDGYSKKDGKNLNLRVVQANISNFLKVDSENGSYPSVSQVLRRYYKLSIAPYELADRPDLIIWPETAYPFGISTHKENLSKTKIPMVFNSIISYWNTEILSGGYDNIKDDPSGKYFKTEYNSAFLFSKESTIKDVYHKQILIPFGETLPLGPLTEYIAPFLDTIAFFSEGKSFTEFKLETGHRMTAAICYEVLKPDYIRKYLNNLNKKPHAIINITNDSWYGDTSEPLQHLFSTKWRALENKIPIIRSTNTGITSIIYPDGSESKRLPVNHTGNLDIAIKLPELSPTVYQTYGILTLFPLWLCYFIFHQLLLRLRGVKN